MNTPNASRFDSVLGDLTGAAAAAQTDTDKLIVLEKLRMENEERRAMREEKARADANATTARSQLMQTLATVLAPVIAGMLNRPAVPPELLALIASGNKGTSLDDIKALLEVQRQQSSIQQESLIAGFKSVMATKDELQSMLLEKALEMGGGGSDDSFMGFLKDIGKAAVPALLERKPEAAAPAVAAPAAAAVPQAEAKANPGPARNVRGMPPAVFALKLMQQWKGGAFPDKAQKRIVKANMVSAILQDPTLADLLNHSDKSGPDPVLEYCKPFIAQDGDLTAFMLQTANQEWVLQFVEDILVPAVQDALDDEDDIVLEEDTAANAAR